MFTLKEVAARFGLKINTLRYWMKKNNDDCEANFYDFNLSFLTQRIKVRKKTLTPRVIVRSYEKLFIVDIEEFAREFHRYVDFIENTKNKKRSGNISWTNTAIECYSCQMNCKKCFNKDICLKISREKGEPPMKLMVRKLLDTIGKPNMINFNY